MLGPSSRAAVNVTATGVGTDAGPSAPQGEIVSTQVSARRSVRHQLSRMLAIVLGAVLATSLLGVSPASSATSQQVLVNPSFEQPGTNNATPTGWKPVYLDNETSPYRLVAATFNASGQYPPPAPIPDGDFGLEMFWQVGSSLGNLGVAVEQTADQFGVVNQDNAGEFSYSAVQTYYANSSVVNWAGGVAEVEFTSGGDDYVLRYFHSNSGSYRGEPTDEGTTHYVIGDSFPGSGTWINATHDLAADIESEFGVNEFTVTAVRVGNLQDRTGTNPYSNMTTYWDAIGLTAGEAGEDTTAPTAQETAPADGATKVSPTTPITVTFDEPVRAGDTLADTTVTPDGGSALTVTPTVSGNTLTIEHPALAAETAHSVVVPAEAVTDAAGNALADDVTWSFTTGTPAPDYTYINEIQGPGASSPLTGRTVTIEGVVTGIDDEVGADYNRTYPEDRGIFVQSLADDTDDDEKTSEGIFVGYVDHPSNYEPGDVVRVTGQVKEKFGLTELAEQVGQEPTKVDTAEVPEPILIDQDRAEAQGADRAYYESLEGSLVKLAVGTANSGGTNKFGETFLTLGDTRDEYVYGESAPASLIALDSDAGSGNPANPYKPEHPSTTYTTADQFDRVEDAVGPLSFSYYHYKLLPQPGALPTVVDGPTPYPYVLPEAGKDELRVVSFNVLNYFPAGGFNDLSVVTEAEYTEKRDRIADAIVNLLDKPDVVALQEVVNLDITQDLADTIGGYDAYLLEGHDSRGIDQAFLIKDSVDASNVRQLGATQSGCDDSGLLYDRPPLAIDITAGDLDLTVINNHYKSKSGPDSCRDAQSAYLGSQVADLEADGRDVVVTGDLNSFETDNAIKVLEQESSLTNLWSRAPEGVRYSNHYQGQLQTLDHTLITDGLEDEFVDFRYAPISTDYADRFTDGHKIADHNPMVLTLKAAPAIPAWDPTVVYHEGDTVSYDGRTFVAQWYTLNNVPTATVWESWMEIGPAQQCTTGEVDTWTASRVYNVGETAEYDGVVYRARWWTRNQNPQDPWVSWEKVADC